MKNALLLLLIFCHTAAGNALSFSGKVRNGEGNSLAGVSILLLRAVDSTIVMTAVSKEGGIYRVEAPASDGSFLIKAVMTGYEHFYSVPLSADTNLLLDITLHIAQKSLDEVTVRSSRPLIEAHADKIVMNVEASIIATGSTAYELLQRAPGVKIDQNDNISLKGRAGVTIMIDGKPQPVRGADLAAILKGMPGGAIDKIEFISNPGARYDAAGTAGIINLVTKKDKRLGTNGSLSAGYGQGYYPKANGSAMLNYRDKKLALNASYNYLWREGLNNLDLDRRFYEAGNLYSIYQQFDEMLLTIDNHTANFGVDYTLSPKTVLGATFTGSLSGFDLRGVNHTIVKDAIDVPSSYFSTARDNVNHWSNWGANINLRHRIDSTGSELSADVDYGYYANSSEQHLNTSYYLPGGGQQQPDYLLFGILDGYTDIRSLKADYTGTAGKSLKLQGGIKTSLVRADNNPAFYDRSGGGNVYDSGKSNHFVYDENINAAYVNASEEGKRWNIQAGLRAEQTVAKGHQLVNDERFDRSYVQLFPSLAVTRHLNAEHDLGLTISRRIDRPNYQQLNPFRRYLDVSSYTEGNPYLQPALTWSAELSHTWKSRFITQLSWSRMTDVILQVIRPQAGTITVVTEQNLATNTIYNLSGTYPLQPVKWWSAMLGFNAYYSYYEGDIAATPLSAGATAGDISAQNTFTLPHEWSAELTAWYQSGQRYGYMVLQPNYILGAGLQKTCWKGAATLRISAADILFRQNPVGTSEFTQYREYFIVKRDSRVVNLTVTIRFGNRSLSPTRRRTRGADDEIRRASGGAG